MRYTITPFTEIDFSPESEVAEILQNVRTIITTRKGSVPLDRDFGISFDFVDQPITKAKIMLQIEVMEAVEKYEPRAEIVELKFNNNVSDTIYGKVLPVVTVSIGEDEEEEI